MMSRLNFFIYLPDGADFPGELLARAFTLRHDPPNSCKLYNRLTYTNLSVKSDDQRKWGDLLRAEVWEYAAEWIMMLGAVTATPSG